MKDRQGMWGELSPGMYLRDATGKVWLIDQERDGYFRLLDRDFAVRAVQRRAYETPVTIVEVTLADAVVIARDKLGGDVLGHKVHAEGLLHCPPLPKSGTTAAIGQKLFSHINVVHRVYLEPRLKSDPNELRRAHDELHDMPIPHRTTIPHDHVLPDL